MKLKGDASFRSLSGKSAFSLNFPKAGPFLGLRKMTLNNMVEDPSMTHETLAYTAFRAAGVPSPRTSFAYVYLNGVDYGLHLDIETLDKVALEKRFGAFVEPPQHLYEGESGADVRPTGALEFEIDEGGADRSDLEALIAATNSAGATPWSDRVAPFVDFDEMTRMWAVEKYVGEFDGYASGEDPFQPNNYYLYSDPSGRFQMFPWGTDETWKEGNHLDFGEGHGLLFTHCLDDTACTAEYREALSVSCGAIGTSGLDALAVSTAALLAPWQQLEQGNGNRHEHDLGEIADGVTETRDFARHPPRRGGRLPRSAVPHDSAAVAASDGRGWAGRDFDVGNVRSDPQLRRRQGEAGGPDFEDQLTLQRAARSASGPRSSHRRRPRRRLSADRSRSRRGT